MSDKMREKKNGYWGNAIIVLVLKTKKIVVHLCATLGTNKLVKIGKKLSVSYYKESLSIYQFYFQEASCANFKEDNCSYLTGYERSPTS